MDFGLMAVDNGTAAATGQQPCYYSLLSSNRPGSGDPPPGDAVRSLGSGLLIKQERSGPSLEEESDRRPCKVPTFLSRSAAGKPPTMLSFSSPEEIPFLSGSGQESSPSKSFCYPFFQPEQKRVGPHSGGASAYGVRGWNESSRGGYSRSSGPFTPPQWMELEHQALIYKHLVANVPIPTSLLIPLTKALNPFAFSGLSSGSYAPHWGWGVGYGVNSDPEPGRCRRTDGKKWRCSRDAVADQKYCERHINRGRHRSRKPVEGQTGRAAVPGSTTTTTATSPKVLPPVTTASVISSHDGGSTTESLCAMKHPHFNYNTHSGPPNPSNDHLMNNRNNRIQESFPMIYPSINLKPQDSTISSLQKHQNNYPYKDSSQLGFGILSSDSSDHDFNGHEHHPVHHFTDGWMTKDESTRGPTSWPKELKPDWTQLSMSIPMASSDFSSSSSSPRQEKPPTDSSLSLSHGDITGPTQKETSNWMPAGSWGNSSMGGPLGEVLNSSYASSPTGVLGNSTFVSRSNSSSGSSPPPPGRYQEG
ncbi:unnamed protein product [Cuscuta epithymum]|uniref:Growth-regulating factor n=1 Tax=Cuscuta epithymum TaxID=186058 RepID=A0AAV0E0R4_9ASTE|nr:unnamed protein product [Cuscuta epithymum]